MTYAYPEPLTRPWVRTTFVASLDGAVTLDGRSGGLSTAADKRVFALLRRLADVVLVGAGTVREERYNGLQHKRIGGDQPPPLAIVTGSANLAPDSLVFTDTIVAPIILCRSDAPADRRDALRRAGGDVVELGDLEVPTILAELDRRGLRRVLCEGGPRLHGDLVAAGAVDELCLTLSPLLTAGEAGRIARSEPGIDPESMSLESILLDEDSTLLLRYRVRAPRSAPHPPIG